jgi:hypothetical protein
MQWRRTKKTGKQQPVSMMALSFEGGVELPVVFRPTRGEFKSYYERYDTVRKNYPMLYMSARVPYTEELEQDMLVLEHLDGYHGDHQTGSNAKDYQSLLEDPEKVDQVAADMFEAVDAILQDPLAVCDVAPIRGHNVMYNTSAQRFQLFDVDTLMSSDAPHAEKFLRFFIGDTLGTVDSVQEAAFIRKMIERYEAAHPDVPLEYMSDIHTRDEVVPASVADESSNTNLIRPGDDGYLKLYMGTDLYWSGNRPAEPPALKHVKRTGYNTVSIDSEVRQAMQQKDDEHLRQLIRAKRGILARQFVEI